MARITQPTLDFLASLKKNNDRDWFARNRKLYEAAKTEYESFVQAVIVKITEFDPILKGLEANSCIFRINRDTRFSHDKSPYKANFGAFIVRGGRKNGDKFAGYYIHLEPGSCMIAGGSYMPPSPWLNGIREKIDSNPSAFIKIINSKGFSDAFGSLQGEKLKTAPKGYSSDHPHIDLLRHKSYLAVRDLKDKEVLSPDFFTNVVSLLKAMKPFNDFLNDCTP